jgi:uncharacterized protein YdhG (YjbR/CyaY superfamily)
LGRDVDIALSKAAGSAIDPLNRSLIPALRKIRATIRRAAPDAEETISYRMQAFEYA